MERQVRTGMKLAGIVLATCAAFALGASEPSAPGFATGAGAVPAAGGQILRFDDLNGPLPLVPVPPRSASSASSRTVRKQPTLAPQSESPPSATKDPNETAPRATEVLQRLPPLDRTAPPVAAPAAPQKYPTAPIRLYPDTGYDPWTPRIKVNVAAVLEGVARATVPAESLLRTTQH